jgi:L-rhamnose isomerase
VLVEWLAVNPTIDVDIPLSELKELSVASECRCGCASIDFAVNGSPVSPGGITVVADYLYKSENGNQMGCFLFMANGHIAGVDVWSVDGAETPIRLPVPSELYGYENSGR